VLRGLFSPKEKSGIVRENEWTETLNQPISARSRFRRHQRSPSDKVLSTKPDQKIYISDLSTEILHKIISFLPLDIPVTFREANRFVSPPQILAVAQVSRFFRALAADSLYWHKVTDFHSFCSRFSNKPNMYFGEHRNFHS